MKTKRDQHQRRDGHRLWGESAKGREGERMVGMKEDGRWCVERVR